MAQLIVRELDDEVKSELQERAKRHGRSMEAEVRDILRAAVLGSPKSSLSLGSCIAAKFREIGLEEPIEELRQWGVRVPDFAE